MGVLPARRDAMTVVAPFWVESSTKTNELDFPEAEPILEWMEILINATVQFIQYISWSAGQAGQNAGEAKTQTGFVCPKSA